MIYVWLAPVALLVAFVVFAKIYYGIDFYSKVNCDVCGQRAGVWGNKRFTLADGYVCQSCLCKTRLDPSDVDSFGPRSKDNLTIQDVSSDIQRRAEVG